MSAWVWVLGVGGLLLVLAYAIWRGLAVRASGRDAAAADAPVGHSQFNPATPRGYSPVNVGNDASARPWESTYGAPPAAALADSADAPQGVPDGFDVDAFLQASRKNFIDLQEAWNQADVSALQARMTEGMLDQIQGQLTDRAEQAGRKPGKTEVVMVDARLLGMEDLGDGHMANVEFSGLLREEGSAGPSPFREIWSISRAKSGGGGWLVAGVQALQ